MLQMILPSVISLIGKAIDKAIPDRTEAEKLKASITSQAMILAETELKGASSIILAEAQGGSWLQRNWRPMLMVWFAILVGAYWFGFTPENLTPESIENLFLLVQIGVGGYIMGRSGEKMVKIYKEK